MSQLSGYPRFLKPVLMLLAGGLLAVAAMAAQATLMRGYFEGTVTATNSAGAEVAPFAALGIADGDVVEGFVQFETAGVTDSSPAANLGDYFFSPAAPVNYMSLKIGSNLWISGSNLWIRVENDYGDSYIIDQIFVDAADGYAQFPGQFGTRLISAMIFRWYEAIYTAPLPSQLAFLPYIGEALPQQSLDFLNTRGEGTISWNASNDDRWALFFSIDPQKSRLIPVPEPSVLWLLTCALPLLVAARRRSR